jgi:hypothetical protein
VQIVFHLTKVCVNLAMTPRRRRTHTEAALAFVLRWVEFLVRARLSPSASVAIMTAPSMEFLLCEDAVMGIESQTCMREIRWNK